MTGEVEIEIYFPIGSHFGGKLVTEDKGGIGSDVVIPVEGDEFSQRYVVLTDFADRQFQTRTFLVPFPCGRREDSMG